MDDPHGFGAREEQGIQDDIDIYFATFAKSMASIGVFIANDKHSGDYMRSKIFAKPLPMPTVTGAIKQLEMQQNMPELKDKLWENVNALQDGLRKRDFDLGEINSCVTTVYLDCMVAEASLFF